MAPNRRKKYLVDKHLQHGLTRRLLIYWCGTWLMVFAFPICTRLFFTSLPFDQLARQLMTELWFPIVMSVLLIPIVAWDSVRFSNRVAGPVWRIARSLRQLSANQKTDRIQLRKDDFCHDLADDVNRLLDAQESEKQELQATHNNGEAEYSRVSV